MGDHSQGKKRIPLPPDLEQELLQGELIRLYRADLRRYRLIIEQDLRPLWKEIRPQYASRSFWYLCDQADEQAWQEEEFGTAPDAALTRYIRAVQRKTGESLGLNYQGVPAQWAMAFVHANVSKRSGPISARFIPHFTATIEICASADGGVVRESIATRQGGEELAVLNEIKAANFSSFNEWEALQEAARSAVVRQIAQLREQFKQHHGPYRNLRAIARQQDDLQLLFACLWGHTKPHVNSNARERLRLLVSKLGIDAPSY